MNEFSVKNDLFCSGVYAIRCKQTGKCYIGSASVVSNRIKQHKYNLKKGRHHNPGLKKDYNAGYDFEISVIHQVQPGTDPDLLIIHEHLCMIELHNLGVKLYNAEIKPAQADPVKYFKSVIIGYTRKMCNVDFDCYYFNYINTKEEP